jgi:hypothetical protein
MTAVLVLKHKTFRAGPKLGIFWTERGLFRSRERLREQAEEFVNEIGAGNVVSVTEEVLRGGLMVTVWYREGIDGSAQPSKTVMDEI